MRHDVTLLNRCWFLVQYNIIRKKRIHIVTLRRRRIKISKLSSLHAIARDPTASSYSLHRPAGTGEVRGWGEKKEQPTSQNTSPSLLKNGGETYITSNPSHAPPPAKDARACVMYIYIYINSVWTVFESVVFYRSIRYTRGVGTYRVTTRRVCSTGAVYSVVVVASAARISVRCKRHSVTHPLPQQHTSPCATCCD